MNGKMFDDKQWLTKITFGDFLSILNFQERIKN